MPIQGFLVCEAFSHQPSVQFWVCLPPLDGQAEMKIQESKISKS